MQLIMISRGTLSGVNELSEKLSDELSYPILEREHVLEEAYKYAINETGLCDISFIDRSPGIWDKQDFKRTHYLYSFQVSLLDLIAHNSSIYVGHLGQYLLSKIPFLFKIRVIQPLEMRAQSWMIKNNVNYEQALNYVKLIDERRKDWSEFLYGVNISDPRYFDLIINLETMNVNTATNIIKEALNQTEFNSTPESLQLLSNYHLSTKAKLYLFLSPITRGIEFSIDINADAENGILFIKGLNKLTDTDKYESFINNVLSKLTEVKKITFN